MAAVFPAGRGPVEALLENLSRHFSSSQSVPPLPVALSPHPESPSPFSPTKSPLIELPGEQLEENFNVHELPSETNESRQENLVSMTLLHRVEALEAENTMLARKENGRTLV